LHDAEQMGTNTAAEYWLWASSFGSVASPASCRGFGSVCRIIDDPVDAILTAGNLTGGFWMIAEVIGKPPTLEGSGGLPREHGGAFLGVDASNILLPGE
jgi:hypothetical protein